MRVGLGKVQLVFGVLLGSVIPASYAQQPPAPTKVLQITGLEGVKNKTKGTLAVDGSNLRFIHAETKVDLSASSVQDVITGNDSQRLVGGTLGTLTMLGPYGSGRFLSLFRTKLDSLTIKYVDADGGLHGAIFTMPVGQADLIKKELVAQGAHTSVPLQEKAAAAKEQKP
jgi:hypothetical protein